MTQQLIPQTQDQQQEDDAVGFEKLPWWKNWKVMLPIWGLIVLFIWLGVHFGIDVKVIAGGVFLFGLLSNAFAWLLGIIAIIPVIGPLLVKILSVGFIWLLERDRLFCIIRCYSTGLL